MRACLSLSPRQERDGQLRVDTEKVTGLLGHQFDDLTAEQQGTVARYVADSLSGVSCFLHRIGYKLGVEEFNAMLKGAANHHKAWRKLVERRSQPADEVRKLAVQTVVWLGKAYGTLIPNAAGDDRVRYGTVTDICDRCFSRGDPSRIGVVDRNKITVAFDYLGKRLKNPTEKDPHRILSLPPLVSEETPD